ncbi:right-handed parallel beta-helix repeat-containing protein [Treponema primitia]|uniref:right-handed parallel beta-helix repeat-containing protein n=1 Tax=Treponema primitia TaxID=88058 RepID=UPI003980551B
MMKKIAFVFALAVSVLLAGTTPLFAQAAERAYYVDVEAGNDTNNGRSQEQAFKSIDKALESAKATAVKKIVLLKPANTRPTDTTSYVGYTSIDDTGDGEITITSLNEPIGFDLRLSIRGRSKFRFENVRLVKSGIDLSGGAQAVIGKDAQVFSVSADGSGTLVTIESNAKIINEAMIYDDRQAAGIRVGGGAKAIVKDDVEITNLPSIDRGFEEGVLVSGGEITIQDNVKITGGKEAGIKFGDGTVTLKGNVSISGINLNTFNPDGGGIEMTGGTLVIQDNVTITGNTVSGKGGGIFFRPDKQIRATITGNVVISGNKAKQGGGIYIAGTKDETFNVGSGTYYFDWESEGNPARRFKGGVLVSLEGSAAIRDNTAVEGGGVYIENGSVFAQYTVDRVKNTATITQTLGGFFMKGGTISGNKADYGAGVYAAGEELSIPEQRGAYTRGNFEVQNTGKQIAKPGFTLTAGSITGNAAEFVGGGIFVKQSGAYAPGKGTVTGNTAGDGEGENVYNLP